MGKGLHHDPLADIELIRQNLKDRYHDGFPVLKELIQNADDANATSITFLWTRGIPGAPHALLEGPGLIVLNNGGFNPNDRDAIRKMGLSHKPAENAFIGKFGLGLKSIFHWCEAFFYLAGNQDSTVEGDILNPWSSELERAALHQEWDHFTQPTIDAITAHLSPSLPASRWFCVWIPYRKRSHLNGLSPIVQQFPGDTSTIPAFLVDLSLNHRLAELFPLLKTLKTIQVVAHPPESIQGLPALQWSVEARDVSGQTKDATLLKGTVRTQTGTTFYCIGEEQSITHPSLLDLQTSPHWPQSTRINRSTGTVSANQEKVNPHAASLFLARPAFNHAELNISWTTFLPLGTPILTVPIESTHSYTLLLHGNFFIDPGRTTPEFGETVDPVPILSESALRQAWNRNLATLGVFPRVLPSLEALAHNLDEKLDDSDLFLLTQGLQQAFEQNATFVRWRSALCATHQWAFCVEPGGGTWRLISSFATLLSLPPPSSDPTIVFDTFSGFKSLNHRITFSTYPHLTLPGQHKNWTEKEVLVLLTIDAVSVFRNASIFTYFLEVLNSVQSTLTKDSVQQVLITIGRDILRSVTPDQLRERTEALKEFFTFIEDAYLLPLDGVLHALQSNSDVLKTLLHPHLSLLPVPHEFVEEWERCPPDRQDATNLLQVLHEIVEVPGVPQIALQVLDACSEDDRYAVLELVASLRLFDGYDCNAQQKVRFNWHELQATHTANLLFQSIHFPLSDEYVAFQLQSALATHKVVLVHREAATALFGSGTVPECLISEVSETLLRGYPLQSPANRIALLRAFLSSLQPQPTGRYGNAVRYLFHGKSAHINSTHALLVDASSRQAPVWRQLANQALQYLDREWCLIPDELTSIISPDQRRAFHVEEFDAHGVTHLLQEVGPEHIVCEDFSEEERETILLGIQDDNVLKNLKIHADLEGVLHTITPGRTFLASKFPLDNPVSKLVTIVAPSPREEVSSKQSKLMAVWGERAVMRVALEQAKPYLYADTILDALQREATRRYGINDLAKDLKELLTKNQWVPLNDGSAVAPADILHIDGMESIIARILDKSGGLYSHLAQVPEGVSSHSAFHYVRDNFMSGKPEVLNALGMLIEEEPTLEAYRLGPITLDTEETLSNFIQVMQKAPPTVARAAVLLYQAVESTNPVTCLEALARSLNARISDNRLRAILQYLVSEHQQSHRSRHQAILSIYNCYLKGIVNDGRVDLVPFLQLLNQNQEWCSVDQLCAPTSQGIDPAYLLDERQFRLMSPLLEPTKADTSPDIGSERVATPNPRNSSNNFGDMQRYFSDWDSYCPRRVIAGFLSLLGDGSIRDLANHYFEGRDLVEVTRSQLQWSSRPSVNAPGWGASEYAPDVIATQRFDITITDPQVQTIQVANILSVEITVPLNQTVEHLLVGKTLFHAPVIKPLTDIRSIPITFRSIQPSQYTERQLSQFLKETARIILDDVYLQKVPNLDAIWDQLHEGEQKDIRVAQNRVADSLYMIVSQYGLRQQDALHGPLKKWDEALRQKAELEGVLGHDAEGLLRRAEQQTLDAKSEVKQLLDTNEVVQGLFLDALRNRMDRHYQYRLHSIPFELFQNADDAVVEWQQMAPTEDLSAGHRRFYLVLTPSELTVMHWGRPINRFRRGSFNGAGRGFDADLEKMLLLGTSDKQLEAQPATVTGRFGMGFKSVFLLAERAELLSGRLACEIVGGLYPRRLDEERRTVLHQQLMDTASEMRDGTLIHLPLVDDTHHAGITKRFEQLAPVLMVFARAIKSCSWLYHGIEQHVHWQEQSVVGHDALKIGHLPALGIKDDKSSQALVIRVAEGALLVRLGHRGLIPFPQEMPSIWVTAPTDMRHGLGFAINASFDLDVGRSQLATDSSYNRALIDRFAGSLTPVLRSLARSTVTNWSHLKDELDLAKETSLYEFWVSIWHLFAKGFDHEFVEESEGLRLLKRLFWHQPEYGIANVIRHHEVIPTGLPGEYHCLTRLDRITHFTDGALAQTPELFEQIAGWKSFHESFPPGTIVDRDVSRTLQALDPEKSSVQGVTLVDVLTKELNGRVQVDGEVAARIGAVLTKTLLDRLRVGTGAARTEAEALRGRLEHLEFKTSNGDFRSPLGLVASGNDVEPEEHSRATFAPAYHVLSDEYRGFGLDLFLLCRTRQPASKDLAEWMRRASQPQQQFGALRYLATGALNREITEHLRGKVTGTWLSDCALYLDRMELSAFDKRLVLALLDQLPSQLKFSFDEERISIKDPGIALEKIEKWWKQNHHVRVSKYWRATFPGHYLPTFETDTSVLRWDHTARKQWLTLFLLGTTFTLGRSRREQHRDFLNWCDQQGWLDRFAEPTFSVELISEALDEYLNSGLDTLVFYHWMRLFVPLYQLSRWLDTYIELFISLDRQQGPVQLNHLLAPNTNPYLTGSGINAPPLPRTLGIGICFVLRELVRNGTLRNPAVIPHCYVPSRPVRGLMNRLGCNEVDETNPRPENASQIYRFLRSHLGEARATFEGGYDLPFLILGEDPGLQYQVLHETLWQPDESAASNEFP